MCHCGVVPKWCFGSTLQGLRAQIPPKHIQAPPISMNTTQIPPNTPRHPPDTPRHFQGTGHANRQQQTPIDTARHTQTAPVSVLGCLAVSVGVCWHVVFPGDSWGVSLGCLVGVWGYLSGNHGSRRLLDVFVGYLGSQPLQYGAKTPIWQRLKRNNFFSPDYSETSKYQNRRI